jgi:carboxypeptidase family protein/TonB-dependent receptor-like protein
MEKMRMRTSRLAGLCLGFVFATALATSSANAQVYTGRIDVTVNDATGAVLPGVTVEVTGPQNATAVTDAQGAAHFLNLAPGNYKVKASLSGFGDYNNTNVPVGAGVSVPLRVTLAVGGVAQNVEVTAESPIIDPKRQTTQTNVSLEELQEVPSSRDPWVVMQTVPGIIMDRVNVGGAESGQQSNYQAKGASGGENTWNMDGIPITDMAALGSSPTYYDFDMFQEMQVTTGGADVRNPTPGVQLNFVLKGGSNTPHGSARGYFENESMQSNNMPSDLAKTIGGKSGKGNRMDQYSDYGFEVGGPILRDHIWAWGAYGKTDVRLRTLTDALDRTKLDNRSFKLTAQSSSDLRGGFTFFRGDKQKQGRGAGSTRPDETTWNQSGPTAMYKEEVNWVVSDRLFLSGKAAYTSGGFQLAPRGGMTAQWYVDDDGIHHGSQDLYKTDRPQWNYQADGNMFAGRHELKFGFAWRKTDVVSSDIVPGNGIISYHIGYPLMIAEVTRGPAGWGGTDTSGKYTSAYVGDTVTWDRLTLNAGLRWDLQTSSVNPMSIAASAVIPNLLPALEAPGVKNAIKWNSVTPRIGFSYAIDENRRTIARASYAMFASQLNATAGNHLNVIQYAGAYFYAVDLNGNRSVDANELEAEPFDWYGFDPSNPGRLSTINSVGDYKTPMTHEALFGLDHEVARNIGVSGTFTYRYFTDFNRRPINGVRSDQYVQVGALTGNDAPVGSYTVPVYGLPAGLVPAVRGREYVNWDGYHQRYLGFELSATKRMANRWMARIGFSSNDHREYFDSASALGSVTSADPTPGPTTPNRDGGLVVRQTSGSGKSGIYMVLPKYQFIATAAFQAPWGINLGMNLLSRQGYAMPYHKTSQAVNDPLSPRKSVLLVSNIDDFRLPSVTSLDARVGKEFSFANRARVNFDLDFFNLLNADTVLGRQYDLRVGTANQVQEIMNPRILRLGLRFNF